MKKALILLPFFLVGCTDSTKIDELVSGLQVSEVCKNYSFGTYDENISALHVQSCTSTNSQIPIFTVNENKLLVSALEDIEEKYSSAKEKDHKSFLEGLDGYLMGLPEQKELLKEKCQTDSKSDVCDEMKANIDKREELIAKYKDEYESYKKDELDRYNKVKSDMLETYRTRLIEIHKL
ncbi:hypothetical protein [Photobacterium leiognathi]|uniref:hypothetical protein n=1 Tax=Photobacterium leiognathi TaxID=553611 RepID=UPI0029816E32|nr:hypothetical protein [Photobacterium leiognathi]